MKLYDVPGYDRPLMLSEEHAELIGGTEHELVETMPAKSATKAEWASYAVTRGADPAVAEATSRADLIAQYGV